MNALDPSDPQVNAAAMRAEAVAQLKSARELAKKVRAEAVKELEDARTRVRKIAAREEEMAERWAKLLEAENQMAMAMVVPSRSSNPDALIDAAQQEARGIIARAEAEARNIREEAMHLLAVAEGEKADSHEKAQSETERAMLEAQRMRAAAEREAESLRTDAKLVAGGESSIYSRGRKLPRIGEGANSLLSEMSGLRSRMTEDEDRKVV